VPEDLKDVICASGTDYHNLLAVSDVALSACGTANLEAALLETPLVAFYRISPFTYILGKPFVKIRRYSIVNILAGKDVIPELIQKDFSAEKLAQETLQLLGSRDLQQNMIREFRSIRAVLGERPASQEAARELASLLSSSQSSA
jgi:lipid-A-disaccharide synthase